jgi:hypothetical protein
MFIAMPVYANSATREDLRTCNLDRDCVFSIRTLNNTTIVNSSVCNITIWNDTDSVFVGPAVMTNHSNGFHNYTQSFNTTGNYYVEISCVLVGTTMFLNENVLVDNVLDNAAILTLIPFGMAGLFLVFAFLSDKDKFGFRFLYTSTALICVVASVAAGAQLAALDGLTNLATVLEAVFMVSVIVYVVIISYSILLTFFPDALDELIKSMKGRRRRF